MLRPVTLRCEYLANPTGIDALHPRLCWELESTRPGARGERQAAWQIGVRRDGGPVVWNSGKVASGETAHIAYAGKPLVAKKAFGLDPIQGHGLRQRHWPPAPAPSAQAQVLAPQAQLPGA